MGWQINRETSELGGEGVAVCPEGFISWVLTPVLKEYGVMVKERCHFSLVTRAHFCRAVIMWEGSIRENEFFYLLACMLCLRVTRPTSSDARFMGEWVDVVM